MSAYILYDFPDFVKVAGTKNPARKYKIVTVRHCAIIVNQRKKLTGYTGLLYNSFPCNNLCNMYPAVPAEQGNHGIYHHHAGRCNNVQNVSAEKTAALERAWFSKEDVDKERPQGSGPPPYKGQSYAFGLVEANEVYDVAEKEP